VPVPPPGATEAPPAPAGPPPGEPRRIQIGDVLNHTYEVRRFIARGGMGEVYEGVNVNAEDDRVAIKVMLPHLAADPLVQAMFAKEAKTLTRLRHPGLVQYRLLGREPNLGVTYIVTEFVEGQNLSDVLRTLETTPADQLTLLRRLASALGAAHELDAIHRDISPDNVLLEGGRLKDAKIIDFGIAKDLDPTAKTIVGEGFAGKLNYVAPEQLGSYGRAIGPWTDVYSLGLVMLAVAQKRDVDMGGSIADAFDKRKAVPDLSAAPGELQPILARMLEPDPAQRLRSMDEVLGEIAAHGHEGTGRIGSTTLRTQQAAGAGGTVLAPAPVVTAPPQVTQAAPTGAGSNKGLLIGGAAAVLLALGVGGYFAFGGGGGPVSSERDPAAERSARQALIAGLPQVSCSWLDLAALKSRGPVVDVALRGVAGEPDRAKEKIEGLLAAAGVTAGSIDFADVRSIENRDCDAVEAFGKVRDLEGNRLTVTQRQYEMKKLGPSYGADAGKLAASPVIQIDASQFDGDVALFGLEDSGAIEPIVTSASELASTPGVKQPKPGVYSFELITDHKGWSGVLLLKGDGPFDPALLRKGPGAASDAWIDRFVAAAEDKGWKSEMVWYRTVDEKPG
jgi:serine/threonine-protein kinase